MLNAIHQARLKLQRANEHINDLSAQIVAFNRRKPHVIRIEPNPREGDVIWVDTAKTVPEEFLLIVGDALHNLRSSLDYLMSGLSGITDEYSKFPIYDTRKRLEAAVNGGLKRKASQDVIRLIVDTIQPYGRGDGDLLWQLHQLNIVDKHQLLIAKTQIILVEGIRAIDDENVEFIIPNWLVVYPYIQGYVCKGHKNIRIANNGKSSCTIVFGGGMPMTGQTISVALCQMSIAVKSTIQIIETAYAGGLK